MRGIVYSETVVHSAPAHLEGEAPYQVAIVDTDDGSRVTGRIDTSGARRAVVGDEVAFIETKNGVKWFAIANAGVQSPEEPK